MDGLITRGEATSISATAEVDQVATTIDTATYETILPHKNGSYQVIATGSHTAVESMGSNTGRFNIALSAAVTANLPTGKDLIFHTKVTISAVERIYWGVLPEVRAPLNS